MLTLCGFPVSNYYNKVKLALLEKGVAFTEETVMTKSTDANVLNASPLAKFRSFAPRRAASAKAR